MNNKEKFLKVWNNPILFIQNFLKIIDKEGKLVPFKLNPPQKDFIKHMEGYNTILKSRQMGFSVAICGLAIYYAVTKPHSTCMMLSHNDESTRAIFNKLKTIYNTLPDAIKPKLIRNNRAELQLDNGSIISCSTMGHTDKSRGNTLRLCHISEFAFVNSEVAEKQRLAIEQAIQGNGQLIIESTANGLNHYHKLYTDGKYQKNAYKTFFYNYVDGACMFKAEYEKYWNIFKNINGHEFSNKDLTEEEIKLMADYPKINLHILCWRRLKIQNSSVSQFNQEYPLTDDLAFVSTGNSVFDNKRVTSILTELKKKKQYINKAELNDLDNTMYKYLDKSLFIYKKPQINERYWIGVDSSEGVGLDSSTFIILNKDGEEMASFDNNKIKPFEYAELINCIGRYYNKAHLVVEKASGGHAVIERLRHDYHYMNMAKYKSYDQYNRIQWNIGFDTNLKTKSLVINDLEEMFNKGQLLIHSELLLEQMKVFEVKNNGSMGAMSGYHDDMIMAMALAIQGLKSNKQYAW